MVTTEAQQVLPVGGQQIPLRPFKYKSNLPQLAKDWMETIILDLWLRSLRPLHSPFKTK